jgi:hypothetical protein
MAILPSGAETQTKPGRKIPQGADLGYRVPWVALGIGIAWVISLLRVLHAVLVGGGLAALGSWPLKKSSPPNGPPPMR